ncbi:unnamed protein product [Rhizophagus irregularis]|nr:unnamed protein product [Rhizophagus irregularis]
MLRGSPVECVCKPFNTIVFPQIGGVIQKGDELCLDEFFGIELIPKHSDVDKFSVEELKNISMLVKETNKEIQEAMEIVKLPALKKELINCKNVIAEVKINLNNLIIDEFSLRWNYIPIEGAFRRWFKELTYNTTKIDIMMLDYVKECFIESGGSNLLIDWKNLRVN